MPTDPDALLNLAVRAEAASVCPKCNGTGWWSESYETGRDGYTLVGGPCDNTAACMRNHEIARWAAQGEK